MLAIGVEPGLLRQCIRKFQTEIHPFWRRRASLLVATKSTSSTQRRSVKLDGQSGTEVQEPGGKAATGPLSAYVHLPFCKRRCYYCDFPIQAVGQDTNAASVQNYMQQYTDLLCQEVRATAPIGEAQLQTVFFGGGTPSLVPPTMLQAILDTLRSQFGLTDDAEISMEADPGTFNASRLQEYMALGVSRFSIGIQAFQQEVLQQCGRSHALSDVYTAIEDVHKAGVQNWSLDLISGLPSTSEAAWDHSLAEALAASPSHISIYDLQVEEKTKFGRWYVPGQFPLPTDEATARMYCSASETLRSAGMEHYEVSSYAQPGHRCRHNMVYWSGNQFHAFGLGAASYLQGRRFSRPRSMSAYKVWVATFVAAGCGFPGQGAPTEDAEERLLDMIMLRLRLSDGLDLSAVAEQFGERQCVRIKTALQPHIERGLVQSDDHNICLKDPDGFLVSNDIISDVFAALD